MKKIIAAILCIVCVLSSVGCHMLPEKPIKEYNGVPLLSLVFRSIDYNGGATKTYTVDFENNFIKISNYLPWSEKDASEKILAEFTEDEEALLINKLYTYGFFDIKDNYPSPPGIVDGGGWDLTVKYSDGTDKKSSGSNNSPSTVFSNCAKAFYDICSDGIVAYVPTEYYAPPNVSYAIHIEVGNNTTSYGATSFTNRGNYKWNGFSDDSVDYFRINQENPFPFELNQNTEYKLVLYTSNYRGYERFKKCVVTSYDYNEEMTGEETVIEKGWFDQIEFTLSSDKIYVIKLSFRDGDFVEYTLNTRYKSQ